MKVRTFFILCAYLSFSGVVLEPSKTEATSYQGTIVLMNDSPHILTATTYTSSGDFLGQITLQPGQQSNFVPNLYSTYLNIPGHPNVSITPYRVIWRCGSGGVYSMTTDGSVGALVRASGGQGQYFCAPDEGRQKKEKSPSSPQKNSVK